MEFRPIAFISKSSERGALGAEAAGLQNAMWTLVVAALQEPGRRAATTGSPTTCSRRPPASSAWTSTSGRRDYHGNAVASHLLPALQRRERRRGQPDAVLHREGPAGREARRTRWRGSTPRSRLWGRRRREPARSERGRPPDRHRGRGRWPAWASRDTSRRSARPGDDPVCVDRRRLPHGPAERVLRAGRHPGRRRSACVAYAGLLVAAILPGPLGRALGPVHRASSSFGFSAWLTYAELVLIDAICAWCVTSAVLVTLALILTAWRAARARARTREEARDRSAPDLPPPEPSPRSSR